MVDESHSSSHVIEDYKEQTISKTGTASILKEPGSGNSIQTVTRSREAQDIIKAAMSELTPMTCLFHDKLQGQKNKPD